MTASNATLTQPPYINGLMLERSIYQSAEVPSLATFLSQSAATGILLSFVWPVASMLANPQNGYNYLLVFYLPTLLAGGMLFGLCEGVTIWATTFLVGHRINPVVRAVLGVVTLFALFRVYNFLFVEPSSYHEEVSLAERLCIIGIHVSCGIVLGLAIGSRFRPFAELIRGTSTERWPIMNGLTGLLLRVFVIFALMVSILLVIWYTQRDHLVRTEFVFAVIAASHFAVAVVITFTRMPFWLLLPLAVIINLPIVAFVTDVLKPEDAESRTLTINYLALWAAFLLGRFEVPSAALSFIKKETSYYPGRE